MNVLIAGGAGFIGAQLTRRFLQAGHRVWVVDNLLTGSRENLERLARKPDDESLHFVLNDVSRLARFSVEFDAICHLASPASPVHYLRHPIQTLEAGAAGTRNLVELARSCDAKFLLASTSEVYGDPTVHPQPETYWGNVNPIGVRAVYDEAKRYAEALSTAYARQYGVAVRIARIFNTYGPGMQADDGRVIPTFLAQALEGRPLTVFGDGSQTRSYCYVDDLIDGLERLLWSEVEGPVNLGNPDEYSVLDTARTIIDVTGSQSRILFRPLPEDDPKKRRPDISRATRLLHWKPRTDLRAGLERMLARSRPDARSPSSESFEPLRPEATPANEATGPSRRASQG